VRLRVALVVVAAVLAAVPAARGANYLRLGFDDDTIKWMVRPDGFVGAQRELGAIFTRITIPWHRGQVTPGPLAETFLARARAAGVLWQKVVIAVYGDAAQAPTDPTSRARTGSTARAKLDPPAPEQRLRRRRSRPSATARRQLAHGRGRSLPAAPA